ncbi:MAG: glycosyl transferase [Lachnospiraceae bacterium]|nr:glycosyl transferase [Lachnospiraceae bacterium]
MKSIMFFCIPAHGHHNPTFPVVKELVNRGDKVRFYSFNEFKEKVEATGATFISCDAYLAEVEKEVESGEKTLSTTDMTIVDLQTTAKMNQFLQKEVEEFKPDVIVSDSVCFWGKLTARKYKIPMVVSTTTFAFNKQSASYMKNSFAEIMDLIKGQKRIKAELKNLEQYGYREKSIMPLVQNDNYTDTIVYATEKYQPFSNTFSKHYAFVGPSIYADYLPEKKNQRPLVYISLGTVVSNKPDFYKKCIEALKDETVDVIISCGKVVDPESLNGLADNVKVFSKVNQLEVLSRANVFLTHNGMNSTSESLYMATPMVLFPQTNEQRAVARRAKEMGAGFELKGESVTEIHDAIMEVINNGKYLDAAMSCSDDFRSSSGPKGAADFIETAPHLMPEEDKKNIRREIIPGVLQLVFWCIMIAFMFSFKALTGSGKWWIIAIVANVIFPLYKKLIYRLV